MLGFSLLFPGCEHSTGGKLIISTQYVGKGCMFKFYWYQGIFQVAKGVVSLPRFVHFIKLVKIFSQRSVYRGMLIVQ